MTIKESSARNNFVHQKYAATIYAMPTSENQVKIKIASCPTNRLCLLEGHDSIKNDNE